MSEKEEANFVQLKVYLEPQAHLVFKLLCTHQRRTMTEVASSLIDEWIEEKAKTVDLNKLLREY